MKSNRVFPAVLLLIVVTGCSSLPLDKENPPTLTEATTTDGTIRLQPEDVKANGFQSAEVVESRIAPVLIVPAHVRTRSGGEVEVFSPFPGRLIGESALPRIGNTLARGQHIADVEQQFAASEKLQLTTTAIELQTSIEQAQQELDLKRIELSRAQELYDGGAIPLKQLQTAQFELKQAESKLEGARRSKEQYDAAQSNANTQVRRAPITAPISGTVVAADATLGQQVDPAKSLLAIADLTTVWVEAAVHERDLPKLRAVREAEIAIPGSEGPTFVGRLVTIGNIVDPENRTVSVIFSVANRGAALKIAMFVEARIPIGTLAPALVIPASALLSEQDAYAVYVETAPGTYERRTVAIGQRKDDIVVVTSGLQKGEKVVSVGAQTLRSESLKSQIPVEEEEKEQEEKR
jgi:membrane fusion protein, heavy metal efflux system